MSSTSRFGMAGHLAAMSEFLLRGYNVAIPFVDRGDDVLTLEDENGKVRRVQVKASAIKSCRETPPCRTCRFCQGKAYRVSFSGIRRAALRNPDGQTPLYFMFMFRIDRTWNFVLISRRELNDIRSAKEGPSSPKNTKDLGLEISVEEGVPMAWNASLAPYFNDWGPDWPDLRSQPDDREDDASISGSEAPRTPDP